MPTTTTPDSVTQAERLKRRLKQHEAEVARLRAEIPNPDEALSEFIRERFEHQALVPPERTSSAERDDAWEENDDLDAW